MVEQYPLETTLFVSDLDFTLLRSDGSLSPFTTAVVRRLIAEGLQFTYATARSHRSASRLTRELELVLPVITYGGTMTVDATTGTPQEVRLVPQSVVGAIIRAAEDRGLPPMVHTYADDTDRIQWRTGPVSAGVRHFVDARPGDSRLSTVEDWSEIDKGRVYYFTLIGDAAALADLRDQFRRTDTGCMFLLSEDAYHPGVHWLEIHSDLGSKANAAVALAGDLGATKLVAFGDNHNDVPLFKVADESYAVANAIPELRRIAMAVIEDNDADAVAHWLARAQSMQEIDCRMEKRC